ncbi:TonB-dependent receptor domain-containing protein [Pontibacter liquoris]|uniref:TonB-dependent receptor domain-containing protein n=1 Tax=Pontibacter liquoris TaxID=2905677 RepID=UPI001FA7A0E3|nr:TonB-dependent receptor [Pontibacter liquoris]
MKTTFYPLSFSLFLLLMPQLLLAQGSISGTVVEGATKAPVGFANVVLLTTQDSSLVTGATSDIEGKFVLEHVPYGQFILRVSLVGYPRRFVPNITVSAASPQVALGQVTMKASATKLNEVQVTAERGLVEYNLDKKVVNVSKDIAAQSGSVAEVMQNIPSVTVDIDGNVSMRGSSNVTILVDGKRTALANLSLDQIPANQVESIELITNPSSKYDPEGTSGIINLVLKKEKKAGLNGSASVTAGTYDNYNGSLFLNFRYNKWSLNGGYDYRQRSRPGTSNSFTTNYYRDSIAESIDSTSFRQQHSKRNGTDISHNFRFGADYALTPNHTLSASALYRTGTDKNKSDILYRFLDENQLLSSSNSRYTSETEDEQSMDLTLGYRQTFETKGQELTADVVYTTNVDDEESTFRQDDGAPDNLPQLQNTLTDDAHRQLTMQADFVRPFSEDSRLEAGYRSSLQRLDDDARFFDFDFGTNAYVYNTNQSNHFVYDEQVHALYTNYSNKLSSSISYQLGLRAEQTITRSNQRTQDLVYDKNYFSLFPTFFITNDFDKDNKLQFSYSRRINRPRSRFLNPFVDVSDPYDVDYGNPRLNPEFINSLELGYLRYWGNSSFNLTTFYRRTTDQIQRYRISNTVLDAAGQPFNRNETTFINLSSNSSYGVEATLTQAFTKWWRMNGSVSGFRTDLSDSQGDTELSNSQLSWDAKLNTTATVWKNLDIQLSAFYRAPMATIQGRMEQMFSTDLGLKKDVLKKKATVSLRVTDLFNTRQFNFISSSLAFRTESENRRQSRIIYLGFTYRINSDDTQRNRKPRDEQQEGSDEEMGY